jgi:putative hydrolase of the HAD superfamily
MKFESVLFDAAETLFTTRGSVGELYGVVARQYGSTADDASIQAAFVRQFQHSGPISTDTEKEWWRQVVHRVFTEVGMIANFTEFFDRVYDQFRDARGWRLFPETREVLAELKSRGLRLGVISNFDSRVYTVMRSLEILSFFDAVTISSETGYAKPHPGIFQAAIAALGVRPSHILLVGDSLMDDVQAGALAGMTSVLIDRRDKYPNLNTFTRITSLRQVIPLLRRSQN